MVQSCRLFQKVWQGLLFIVNTMANQLLQFVTVQPVNGYRTLVIVIVYIGSKMGLSRVQNFPNLEPV